MERTLDLAAAAISAASAASVNLIEAIRTGGDLAGSLTTNEVSEDLADALQSALTIEHPTLPDGQRKEALGQLLGAVGKFLEGWA